MTCVDVLCKPFSTTFPAYPRTSYTGDSSHSQSLFKMQEPLDLGTTTTTSLPLSSSLYQSSSLPSSSRSSVIVPSTSSTTSSTALPIEEMTRDSEPKIAHYLGVNCVLFTYFTGDTCTVVDDHFTRALNQTTAYDMASSKTRNKDLANKTPSRPMTARNLPPSFWNSSYQPQGNQHHFLGHSSHSFHGPSSSSVGVSTSSTSELSPFHSSYLTPALHSLSNLQADSWAYSFPTPSTGMPYPHRPVPYDLSYSAASRLGQNYSSFLVQPSAVRSAPFSSMGGHCEVPKTSDHNRGRFSDHRFGTDYGAHSSCTAMDAATGLQEATKDLYWF